VAQRPANRRGALQVVNLTSNDIKNGYCILIDGSPWRVMEFLHVKPGKGSAFVRSKLKSYITGNTVEKTFRAGEPLESARIDKQECQFTYTDGDSYVFMDMETYEEARIPEVQCLFCSISKYLKEGMTVNIVSWEGKTISVDLPNQVDLEVAETDPGVKGNTQGGGSKPATLETGAVVQVPLFIQPGELIQVDTRTDTYLGRSGK
ncbi:elongation factor P-like, partial [Convolutriloba macropyga]|uniref:elongation factor P-like n=1 Tax=Convolutriloba macropyga TaxID=536237 RepID=UPI003F52312F